MTTVAAAWFAVVFFTLPGFVFSWVAGMKAPAAGVAALPVTFGLFGVTSWFWGLTSAPYNLWTFGVSMVVALLAAAAWRYMFVRRARRGGSVSWRRALFPGDVRKGSIADPYWVLPAFGVGVGAFMAAAGRLRWLERMPNGVYNIVQGWDVQWHANLVRFIMDEGVASATRMGELQNVETQLKLFYPSAYHAGIALFGETAGLDPIPALNIASAVLPALALPATLACLVFAFLRSTGVTAQIAAALAAIMGYAAPQLFWIPDYVGMWPYLFAVALTGTVTWLLVTVPRRRASALPAALAFVAVLCVHPSAVTIVVLAVGFYWLTSTLISPERTRLADTLWIAMPAVAGVAMFVPQVLAGSAQAGEVASWRPEETLGVGGAWGTALRMETRHVLQFFPAYDPTVLLWLAAAGAVVCLLWRRQIWPVLFYAVSLAITANALVPFGNTLGRLLDYVGNLHYSTGHRLIMPVVMAVTASAAIAVAAGIRVVTAAPVAKRYAKGERTSAIAGIVVACIVASAAIPMIREHTDHGAEKTYAAARVADRMVDAEDLEAFDWLATQPAAWEGLTAGDPADGYSWMYAYNGVPTLNRHYLWPNGGRGTNGDIMYWNADFIGEGEHNLVDETVENLNVKFFLLSPGAFWNYQYPPYEMLRDFWVSNGVTPVYRKGKTAIFAVNSQFSEAELEEMIADGKEHGSDELFALAEVGATQ